MRITALLGALLTVVLFKFSIQETKKQKSSKNNFKEHIYGAQ